MPQHKAADGQDLERRIRRRVRRGEAAEFLPAANVAGPDVSGPTGDVLGLQRSVGNHQTIQALENGPLVGKAARPAGPAPVARKADGAGGPLLVQRASFAELMSFWKKQELGQETPTPAPKKGNATPNLGPQVATGASTETQALNPVIEEPKEAEKAGEVSSPVSATLTGTQSQPPAKKYSTFVAGALSGAGTGSVGVLSPSPLSMFSKTDTPSSTDDSSPAFTTFTPSAQVQGNKTKVKYLENEEARREFQLDINGTIKQGGQPYDTSKMYSKFKGDGFGIYVMGKDGRFFSTSHKIGLFHHSSFLGGGDVAGAGEMKVEGGELKYLTNKSGHYWPGDRELGQTIDALKKAGASGYGTASLAQLLPSGGMKDPYPGGLEGFLTSNPFTSGSGNKDVVKYNTKPMNDTHKGEDQESLSLVRQIIQAYVPLAQQGKLKKFNKPNSDFGKSVDDIKALVLAEFGWSDEDTVTYAAVLENWNNTKTIGAVTGVPPMQASSPLSGSSWLNSSPVSKTATGSGSSGGSFVGSTSGRDWDEELEALLAKNPSPDWASFGLSPYGPDSFVIMSSDGSWTYLNAKIKVQLLTGEKTIDDLRS